MNDLIFNVLAAVVVAMIGIIMKQLLPYLKKKQAETDAKLRKTRWSWCADIIDAIVRAVEQTAAGALSGEDKKEAAEQYIYKIFDQTGLSLSEEQIDALIEAAVEAMNENKIEVETIAPEEGKEAEA